MYNPVLLENKYFPRCFRKMAFFVYIRKTVAVEIVFKI